MFLTNDQVYHRLTKEGIQKIERGAIVNKDDNDCLVSTKNGNLYYIDESFFDKYNIEEILELCYGEEIVKDYKMFRYNKTDIKKNRQERLSR